MFCSYQYETSMSHSVDNATESILPCLTNHSTVAETDSPPSEESRAGNLTLASAGVQMI